MKKNISLFATIACLLLFFNACSSSGKYGSVDLSSETKETLYDSYSGSHGDGASCVVYTFSNENVLNQIKEDPLNWKTLPPNDTLEKILYGKDGYGPIMYNFETGNPLVPVIEHGYYYLRDRHSEAAELEFPDYERILNRSSFNFTLVIYDTDTNKLYEMNLDT